MNEPSPTWTSPTRGRPMPSKAANSRTSAGRNGGAGPTGRTRERAERPSRVAIRPMSDTTSSVRRPTQVRGERTVVGIAWGYGKLSALRDRDRSLLATHAPPRSSGTDGREACRRSRRLTLRDPPGFGQSSFPAIPPGTPTRHRGGPLGGVGPGDVAEILAGQVPQFLEGREPDHRVGVVQPL